MTALCRRIPKRPQLFRVQPAPLYDHSSGLGSALQPSTGQVWVPQPRPHPSIHSQCANPLV
eukprot:9201201-Alexandrium_andersonii.AAC.1